MHLTTARPVFTLSEATTFNEQAGEDQGGV